MTIKVKDGKVKVDNANVVKTDILCGNGVIHVIDAVILPKKRPGPAGPNLSLAFCLDGFANGRPVSVLANGRGLTLLVNNVSTLLTLSSQLVGRRKDPFRHCFNGQTFEFLPA